MDVVVVLLTLSVGSASAALAFDWFLCGGRNLPRPFVSHISGPIQLSGNNMLDLAGLGL